jgi:hypothetical protein
MPLNEELGMPVCKFSKIKGISYLETPFILSLPEII